MNKCPMCGHEEPFYDDIAFWWMHDNHTFTSLMRNSLEEIYDWILFLKSSSPYGMLCSVRYLKNGCYVGDELTKNIHAPFCVEGELKFGREIEEWYQTLKENKHVQEFFKKKRDGAHRPPT